MGLSYNPGPEIVAAIEKMEASSNEFAKTSKQISRAMLVLGLAQALLALAQIAVAFIK